MVHKLHVFKTDLHNVFIDGNASNIQMARVFIVLAIPVITICLIALNSVKY